MARSRKWWIRLDPLITPEFYEKREGRPPGVVPRASPRGIPSPKGTLLGESPIGNPEGGFLSDPHADRTAGFRNDLRDVLVTD